ncbi:alpha-1,2-mannosidase-3 [Coleophoma cylindrospora]|uniref:alpha-1,2-Mannosidase n=1 Tax=Coleophoma cylindrospora TaxID=1849047 RepID=A0A3D8R6T2_9HELO|nr:alpha-1,2-mannosidase-3 [Coleophoma cylindrospora]
MGKLREDSPRPPPGRLSYTGPLNRKTIRTLVLAIIATTFLWFARKTLIQPSRPNFFVTQPIFPEQYPVKDRIPYPSGRPLRLPRIQHAPIPETLGARAIREHRLQEVRDAAIHAWEGYKKQAWTEDELRPVNGGFKSPFCGWSATLVDSLDTLWIMGLYDEFKLALVEVAKIDFTNKEGCQINLFETTIRHLGGFLAAFDISGGVHMILLEKAVELAEILYTAFDTPNRMPSPHYYWSATNPNITNHLPSSSVVLAVLGSLQLEFTRLSQLTGNMKYFDAVQRVMNELEKWQNNTQLPGMWPAMVDATKFDKEIVIGSPWEGSPEIFTLGALADSTYEYLPKQFMMLGGVSKMYQNMYESFVEVAKKHLIFRPMTVGDHDILISGTYHVSPSTTSLDPDLQHLTCFTGGMLAIAGKIFQRADDVETGRRLADGCIWAYRNTLTGIMPETLSAVPCADKNHCPWDEKKWWNAMDPNMSEDQIRQHIRDQGLSPGFAAVSDRRYLLRPEAIESVFIMYRITGEQYWADAGWDMFKSIQAHTTTALAHSAINDVTSASPKKVDEMESFWLAETLKYFYLLYSTPDVINLDEYVL